MRRSHACDRRSASSRQVSPAEVTQRPIWSAKDRAEAGSPASAPRDAFARPLIEELETGEYDASSLFMLVNGGAPMNSHIARLVVQSFHRRGASPRAANHPKAKPIP